MTPTINDFAVPVLEAARRLGCGRSTVFELLALGQLQRAFKVGRRTLVTTASVTRLLSVGTDSE